MKDKDLVYTKHIGKKIKIARLKAGYSQEELAEELSLSSRYISQLERGISFGGASTIINICKTLHITADFLFGELIDSENNYSNIFDIDFSKNYMSLTPQHKRFLNVLVEDLIKEQNKSKNKKISN